MGTPTLALEKKADPTPEEVRFILSGNLCRCTGYQKIGKCKKPCGPTLPRTSPLHGRLIRINQ